MSVVVSRIGEKVHSLEIVPRGHQPDDLHKVDPELACKRPLNARENQQRSTAVGWSPIYLASVDNGIPTLLEGYMDVVTLTLCLVICIHKPNALGSLSALDLEQ